MTTMQWQDNQARLASKLDQDLHLAIKADLPADDLSACPGTGAHNFPAMRAFLEDSKAINLLEIGFNQGHSTMLWARAGTFLKNIVSVDIVSRPSHLKAVFASCSSRGIKFRFIHGQSGGIDKGDVGEEFTAAFVDGDHTYEGIMSDIAACRRVGVMDILFDDWLPQYGDTQAAVQDSGLRVVWVMGNMAYCRDDMDGFKVWDK